LLSLKFNLISDSRALSPTFYPLVHQLILLNSMTKKEAQLLKLVGLEPQNQSFSTGRSYLEYISTPMKKREFHFYT
jgi:ABC-type methionine transport system ATPase subunit